MNYTIIASSFTHAGTIEKVVTSKDAALAEAAKMAPLLPMLLGMKKGDLVCLDIYTTKGTFARYHVSLNSNNKIFVEDRKNPKAIKNPAMEKLIKSLGHK